MNNTILPYSMEDIAARFKKPRDTKNNLPGKSTVLRRAKQDRQSWKRAAVLIALVNRDDGLTMLLTKRAGSLHKHSGEVSFPGGKVEPSDNDDQDAALREAFEEIGLKREAFSILGELPFHYTSSGYEVRPIVGIVQKDTTFKANQCEVAEIFEVPLSYLMNPANYLVSSGISGKQKHPFYTISYQNHYIWGATALMIRSLYERLYV